MFIDLHADVIVFGWPDYSPYHHEMFRSFYAYLIDGDVLVHDVTEYIYYDEVEAVLPGPEQVAILRRLSIHNVPIEVEGDYYPGLPEIGPDRDHGGIPATDPEVDHVRVFIEGTGIDVTDLVENLTDIEDDYLWTRRRIAADERREWIER